VVHLVYLTGFKNRVSALLRWAITVISNDRSERTTTEQQIFARSALARLTRGATDLVSEPGEYDAAQEAQRRADLEARALEEARLTDTGARGVPAGER
jgi:NADH dehydrogenase